MADRSPRPCRICGSATRLVLDYGDMPLAGGFAREGAPELSETYPLRLIRCGQCTLLQVDEVVPADRIFRTYSYASSTTRTLSTHFDHLAGLLVDRHAAPGDLVVEIGANDGVLVRPLMRAGLRVVGVDPSDVSRRASAENHWTLIPEYFTEDVAREIRQRFGPAQLVVGSNVFAHADDVRGLFAGVPHLLGPGGVFVFEVHYQGDLLETTQFDTVYHEHVCYYSLTALDRLCADHGLAITDVEHTNIHAGSIRVTARLTAPSARPASLAHAFEREAAWDVEAFARRAIDRRDALARLLRDLGAAGRRIVAYGAAGRATVLLNFAGLGPDIVSYVIDMSPLRHGRCVPGVKTPIVPAQYAEQMPPDYVLITAWNYEQEIIGKEKAMASRGARFLVPLPEIRVVTTA